MCVHPPIPPPPPTIPTLVFPHWFYCHCKALSAPPPPPPPPPSPNFLFPPGFTVIVKRFEHLPPPPTPPLSPTAPYTHKRFNCHFDGSVPTSFIRRALCSLKHVLILKYHKLSFFKSKTSDLRIFAVYLKACNYSWIIILTLPHESRNIKPKIKRKKEKRKKNDQKKK